MASALMFKRLPLILSLTCAAACAASASSVPPPQSARVAQGDPSATSGATDPSGWCSAKLTTSQESKHGVTGSFAELNAQFLAAHARARADECSRLERERLVIRYSSGALEARWKGHILQDSVSVLPEMFHPLKDISHAVFLAALLLDEPAGADRDAHVAAARAALAATVTELGAGTSEVARMVPADQAARQTRLVAATQTALADFAAGNLDEEGKQAYFSRVRADLAENLRTVSGALVRALDKQVRQLREKVERLDPTAWKSVVVVVVVTHQARAREIGVQYFERLLEEPMTEGARNERRMVIAEEMTVGEQYGLLSAHLVDRRGAERVFGDASRLQSDVLADDGGVLEQLVPAKPAGVTP